MVYKYQTGGTAQPQQANPELDKIFSMIDAQPEQAMQAIMQQGNVTAEQAAQVVALGMKQGKISQASAQKAIQILQAMRPKNRLGAKLNYIKLLKNDCPEGFEVKYFKEGGRVCKKCIERAAGGEKVKDGKKEIAEFKKACKGRKFEDGGKSQKPKYTKDQIAGRTPVKVVNGVKYFLNGDGQVVKDPKGKNSGSWTQEDDNKMLKYRLKGTKNPSEKRGSIQNQMKWNNLPESEKRKHEVQEQKCGGKAKKHQQGGSLNRIPFFSPVLLREE